MKQFNDKNKETYKMTLLKNGSKNKEKENIICNSDSKLNINNRSNSNNINSSNNQSTILEKKSLFKVKLIPKFSKSPFSCSKNFMTLK